MFRVMIVEDEDNIREGVASLIKWEEYGFEQPFQKASAVDALEFLDHESVDLIITDIYMPVLNGLEFAKMVKQNHPDTVIVILTGHERFELAQEAISLGIKSYLLKPVCPDELSALLSEIGEELQGRIVLRDWIAIAEQKLKDYMPVVQDRFFHDLISGNITDANIIRKRAQAAEVSLDYSRILCIAVRLSGKNPIQISEEMAVRQIIKVMLKNAYIYSMNYEGMELVILKYPQTDRQMNFLQLSIRENLGVRCCIGIGNTYSEITDLKKSASEAVDAAKIIRSSDTISILRYRDAAYWKHDSSQYPFEIEKKLFDTIRFREHLDESILKQFFQAAMPPNHSLENARLILLQFFAAIQRLAHEYSIEIGLKLNDINEHENLEAIEKQFGEALKEIVYGIKNSHERYVSVMVKQAKKIMNEEYTNPDLSVIYLADKLSVTPNYLSRIFSAQTGETCIEYLTEIRMKAAREMLLHSDKKSYLIAYEIGYKNPNYFSALFKKREGVSPREFRERNKI